MLDRPTPRGPGVLSAPRQPQELMNDCSIERHVNPNPRFDLT